MDEFALSGRCAIMGEVEVGAAKPIGRSVQMGQWLPNAVEHKTGEE